MADTHSWCDTEVIQKLFLQMLAFRISTNLFTLNSTQGGQSCRLLKPTATRPFPGKAPYHETAQSSQLLFNPTKQEEKQDFPCGTQAAVCSQVSAGSKEAKADFPPALICKSLECLDAAQTGLSHLTTLLKQDFKTKPKKNSKSKGFLQIGAD